MLTHIKKLSQASGLAKLLPPPLFGWSSIKISMTSSRDRDLLIVLQLALVKEIK